jgi:hypothetical protein
MGAQHQDVLVPGDPRGAPDGTPGHGVPPHGSTPRSNLRRPPSRRGGGQPVSLTLLLGRGERREVRSHVRETETETETETEIDVADQCW